MNHYGVCRAAPTLPESAYYPSCAVNTLLRIASLVSLNQPPQPSAEILKNLTKIRLMNWLCELFSEQLHVCHL